MLLEGSIQRFKLTSVLQFLAQNEATGVLEVHDFEEYGFIYLVDGRVEGISLPISDEKLGRRLVEVGCLSEQQLAEVLLEDSALTHEEKKEKPLGQRLVEKGLASEVEMREVMRWQTLDLVFELAHWQNGDLHLRRARADAALRGRGSKVTCRSYLPRRNSGSTRVSARVSGRSPWVTRYATRARSATSALQRSRPSTSRTTYACGAAWTPQSTIVAVRSPGPSRHTAPRRRRQDPSRRFDRLAVVTPAGQSSSFPAAPPGRCSRDIECDRGNVTAGV